MSDKKITTAAIADFVKSHSPIAAPAVGKHFGKPYWTGEIDRAAEPLIESGQITISTEQGVVWVESPEPKRIETQQSDSDPLKGNPLPNPKESLTGANTASFSGETRENNENGINNEVFSFFRRGDQSKQSDSTGDITQLHEALTSHEGWKRKIENLRSLTEEEQSKEKSKLPAFTPSILITREMRADGKDAGGFRHTDLIQADFDKSHDFDKLFDALCRDPHARLIFRSPRAKVKALIKVNTVETTSDHTAAFETVRSYCQAQGYGEIDIKPKNINCLCYISYDPSAVIKDAKPLKWVPLPAQNTAPRAAPTFYDGEPTEITEWLKAHRIIIRDTRNHQGNLMYLVDCPWEHEHTQDFGHKDTAVFVDPTNGKWCFNCFHDHCDHRSWKEYRQAVAPKDEIYTPPKRKPLSKSKRRLLRTQQLYGGRR